MNQGTAGTYELLFPRTDTGSDNRVEAGKEYVVPATEGWFRIGGPAGQDVMYWLVSPVELPRGYQRLPPPPPHDPSAAVLAAAAVRRYGVQGSRRVHRQFRRSAAGGAGRKAAVESERRGGRDTA